MKRQRGRGRRSSGSSNNPNRHFESNGPDVKIRGSAQQILDKYLQYARDAQTSGDRVNAENYFQHAEHYARIVAQMQPKEKPRRPEDESGDGEGKTAAEASPDGVKADGEPTAPAREPRRRRQPAGEASEDALKVIEPEKTETDGSADEAEQTDAKDAEKPKPRRRTYRKRGAEANEAADAAPAAEDDGADGVLKTLSRGREQAEASAETPPEAPAE